MEQIMGLIVGVSTILIIGLLFLCYYFYRGAKKANNESKKDQILALGAPQYDELTDQLNKLTNELNEKLAQLKSLQENYNELKVSYDTIAAENIKCGGQLERLDMEHKRLLETLQGGTPQQIETRLNELKEQIAKIKNELVELDNAKKEKVNKWNGEIEQLEVQKKERLDKLNGELEQLYQRKTEENNAVEGLLKRQNELITTVNGLEKDVKKAAGEKDQVCGEIDKLRAELDSLKEQNRVALGVKENGGFHRFKLGEREKKLVELVREIEKGYPELEKDLAKIEWSKVWLPQLQKWCSEVSGICGIYRLRVIGEEGKEICYVGQAKDIKERWYQHVKKMVGVDSKGGELLYDYEPDQLEWGVVETVEEKELNERERYWIEFFGCREIGLNRR